MNLGDRLLTIAVTATLTSAAWILLGPAYFGPQSAASGGASVRTGGVGGNGAEPRSLVQAHRSPMLAPAAGEVGDLAIPVAGVEPAQLVDSYSDERADGGRLHQAIDIMAPAGTPVLAAAPGRIERLFLSEDGGNTIYLRSADRRLIYYYAHLQRYAPGLREGRAVTRGQPLGFVGSTGNAAPEAPHLHFAMLRTAPGAQWWEPANALDPYPLLGGR